MAQSVSGKLREPGLGATWPHLAGARLGKLYDLETAVGRGQPPDSFAHSGSAEGDWQVQERLGCLLCFRGGPLAMGRGSGAGWPAYSI